MATDADRAPTSTSSIPPVADSRKEVTRVRDLVRAYASDPESLFALAQNTKSRRQFRRLILAYALLRDPGPRLLEFVGATSLSEAHRIFALECYVMERSQFTFDERVIKEAINVDNFTNVWARRTISNRAIQRTFWDIAFESSGTSLFHALLDASTEKSVTHHGKVIPDELGHRLLNLAAKSHAGGYERSRAMMGIMMIGEGESDSTVKERYEQFIDQALSGADDLDQELYFLVINRIRSGDGESLIKYYSRARTELGKLLLVHAIAGTVGPTSSDGMTSFLSNGLREANHIELKYSFVNALGATESSEAKTTLVGFYEANRASIELSTVTLSALSGFPQLTENEAAWILGEARTDLLRLSSGRATTQEDRWVFMGMLLADVLATLGENEELRLLDDLSRSSRNMTPDFSKALEESAAKLKSRLSERESP